MKFLSNVLTFALVTLFTISASASTYTNLNNVNEDNTKKEIVKEDGDSKENTEETEDNDLTLTDLELNTEIVNKAKPAQLEIQNTSISLDLDINDKIELSPRLN